MTTKELLDLPVNLNGESTTVRNYFFQLLDMVWREGEAFDGKRPFGNSGWQYEIYATLIKHSLIDGQLDEYGCVEKVNPEQADAFISAHIIKALFFSE